MDLPEQPTGAAALLADPRLDGGAVECVLRLQDCWPWVGSPGAQEVVDGALTAIVTTTLGPSHQVPAPEGWMLGGSGRADLASVRASVGPLRRAARRLPPGPVPAACSALADALDSYADELVEVSLQHRRGPRPCEDPTVQPIGALRAAKRLTADCRRVLDDLERA